MKQEKTMLERLPRSFILIADFAMNQKEKKVVNAGLSPNECGSALQ
jgi:hypothetical protein